MKICVYTCITGSYDKVNEIKFKEPNIDYYLFTNNKKIKSNTWEVVYLDSELSDQLLSREIKILGHKIIDKYDVSVYIDGNIILKKKISEFLKDVMSKNDKYVAFKHSERNSIAEEMEACIEYKKEKPDKIEKLKEFYKKENFKDDIGLAENTIHVKRHHDPTVKKTMKIWYNMVENYSGRDQLSLMYAISKTKLKVKWIDKSVWDNEWFANKKHQDVKKQDEYKVYVSKDKQYSEDNVVKGKYIIDGKKIYTAKFNNPISAKEIRFDPTEINNLKATNVKLQGEDNYDIEYHNCIKVEDTIYFVDTDPYFIIKGKFDENKDIEMTMKLAKITPKDIDTLMKEYKKQNDKLNYYENREKLVQEKMKKIDKVENSLIWRILRKIVRIFKRNGK